MASKDEMNFKGKVQGDFKVDKSIKGSKIEKSSDHEEILNVEQDIGGSVDINKSITDSEVRSFKGWTVALVLVAITAIAIAYFKSR